jgi:hypothetical protein
VRQTVYVILGHLNFSISLKRDADADAPGYLYIYIKRIYIIFLNSFVIQEPTAIETKFIIYNYTICFLAQPQA